MAKISIIIPIYNSEKYLSECINSVIKQSFSDFELLLINDGSTDKSIQICESFAQIDARIRVFNKENGGVSSARNFGIKQAKGDWICFVDSDDTIDATHLENFDISTSNEVELVVQGFLRWRKIRNFIEGYYVRDEFIKHAIIYPFGPCSKIYKKSVLMENKILFSKDINYGEDELFNLLYLVYTNNIQFINKNTYNYRDTPGSLSKVITDYTTSLQLFVNINKILKILTDDEHIRLLTLMVPIEKVLKSIFMEGGTTSKDNFITFTKNYREELLFYFNKKGFKMISLYFLLKFRFYNQLFVFYKILWQIFRKK